MSSQPATPQYVLGRSEAESQRLIQQSGFMRTSTERVFRKAGITTGMRVLDLGCGVGDVSFLAAEIVGPTGSVVGIDSARTARESRRCLIASSCFRVSAAVPAAQVVSSRRAISLTTTPITRCGLR